MIYEIVATANRVIMGLGLALSEETLFDERSGRIINPSLAEYHVPVYMDVPAIEVLDRHLQHGSEGRMTQCGQGWECRLSRSVVRKHGSSMHTLPDARVYVLALPPGIQHQEDWQHAAHLLLAAVDSASETDIEQATFQLERALLLQRQLAPRRVNPNQNNERSQYPQSHFR
jgi:Molybdopterin-binding domain of aldehyde dehydrogenase